jgi:hypothetical protein
MCARVHVAVVVVLATLGRRRAQGNGPATAVTSLETLEVCNRALPCELSIASSGLYAAIHDRFEQIRQSIDEKSCFVHPATIANPHSQGPSSTARATFQLLALWLVAALSSLVCAANDLLTYTLLTLPKAPTEVLGWGFRKSLSNIDTTSLAPFDYRPDLTPLSKM